MKDLKLNTNAYECMFADVIEVVSQSNLCSPTPDEMTRSYIELPRLKAEGGEEVGSKYKKINK